MAFCPSFNGFGFLNACAIVSAVLAFVGLFKKKLREIKNLFLNRKGKLLQGFVNAVSGCHDNIINKS